MQPDITFWVITALLVDMILGVVVFWTNHRRITNQHFLTLSFILASWLLCLAFGFKAGTDEEALFWIRAAHVTGLLVPAGFNFMRLCILQRATSWHGVILKSKWWLLGALPLMALCLSPLFFTGAHLRAGSIAEPKFGPAFPLYQLFYLTSLVSVVTLFVRGARTSSGIQRIELQFILLGLATCLLVSMSLTMILPVATGDSDFVRFAPIGVILLHAIIAYGIATRRIMEVAHVLRLATAYGLLAAYLILVYAVAWLGTDQVLTRVFGNPGSVLPHMMAAIAVALSLAPAHGKLQEFANRLFVNVQGLDISDTMRKANRVLGSIRTLDELLAQFSDVIGRAVGTDRVVIFLADDHRFTQRYPKVAGDPPQLNAEDPIVEALKTDREPLVTDVLQRIQPSALVTRAGRRLAELNSAVAVPIQSKSGVEGVMLLGPRLSGRIYGSQEQSALQILCNNLAVAIENAKLYTQVQDSAIYNDILLDQLVSGVIAANAARIVTVFNREACRITRLDADQVIGRTIEHLPYPIAQALGAAFDSGRAIRDQEVMLRPAGKAQDEIPIRLGTALFHSHTGKALGALLVFNDLSAIRKLEQQVRRTDRLASLGTLSAGMAHEIKNPLVTLKTFTQLLPERYEDPDFRETFSTLLGQEVKRIDSLVNQLLRFARPTKPSLAPIHLHAVVENTLKLVHQQLRQKGITLNMDLSAASDLMMGDNDLLVQALLNFLLNAIDAIEGRGELTVSTRIIEEETNQTTLWGRPVMDPYIRLSIRDTGKGISPEDLPHVFDPFFTTKSTGTGLGLSVAHGILHEHHGLVDVESTVGIGTTFHLAFPLARKEATV